jgi:hypothetical protein
MIVNSQTGTRIDEVGSGIYRICTPTEVIPGGFTCQHGSAYRGDGAALIRQLAAKLQAEDARAATVQGSAA